MSIKQVEQCPIGGCEEPAVELVEDEMKMIVVALCEEHAAMARNESDFALNPYR